MSFDCQFKIKDGHCRRINKECAPGVKGCILYGRFAFPLKEDEKEQKNQAKENRPSEES